MTEPQRFRISKDITPERTTELLQLALVSLGEILILDRSGRMVYISESYAKNMGVSMDEALGRNITEIIPDSRLPQVLKTGEATMGDMYYRNGNAFWVNRMPLWENGEIVGVVAQSILTSQLETENLKQKLAGVVRELNYYKEKYKQISTAQGDLDTIISKSPVMKDLKDTLRMISGTRSTVLITGESGTGKELFACAIHNLSGRRGKPFIRLNCAAIPDTLLESELFGYEEGAFTGALRGGKMGDFEAANGGSIFLDEVDSLSPNMQAKLLRVIQEREIKKVGSTKTVPIDVRFIFATNKDLYQMMKEGKFREDFYYRINVIHLRLPPLRERPEDIMPLVESFLQKFNQELDRQITGLTPAAALALEQYQWPGNIRELENCIERAFNYTTGTIIDTSHLNLPGTSSQSQDNSMGDCSLKQVRDHAEKTAIQHMLEICNGNKKEAAERLGIDRSILYDKIRRYGLNGG